MGPFGQGATEEDARNMLRAAKAAGRIMIVPPKMFKHPFVQQMCAEFPGVIHESKPLMLSVPTSPEPPE